MATYRSRQRLRTWYSVQAWTKIEWLFMRSKRQILQSHLPQLAVRILTVQHAETPHISIYSRLFFTQRVRVKEELECTTWQCLWQTWSIYPLNTLMSRPQHTILQGLLCQEWIQMWISKYAARLSKWIWPTCADLYWRVRAKYRSYSCQTIFNTWSCTF